MADRAPLPADEVRAAILRRRARFVAAAMTALATEQCGAPGRGAASPPAATSASSASSAAPGPSMSTSAPRDADGDGIADPDDACPTIPGVASARPGSHGCPAAVVRTCLSIVILERPRFDPGSAQLRPEALAIVDAAAAVMRSHPELEVELSGHCDAAEQPCPDAARAQVVRDEIVRRGVDGGRLRTRAAGRAQPVEPNATADGRAHNRRVEFSVLPKP